MRIKTFFSLIALSIVFYAKVALALDVYVDKNVIGLGETLTLTIETEQSGVRPDLSPLTHDFDILGTSSSTQTSIINGQMTSSRSWHLTLSPKKKGQIKIPPITVGKKTSKSIDISVSNTPQTANSNNGFFMKAEVDNKTPFVQQQIIYTIKIYDNSNLSRIMPEEPKADDMQFVKLGDYSKSYEYLNGQRYEVYNFKYAVFPQKSGKIEIPPIIFEVMTKEHLGSSLFDFFNQNLGARQPMQIPDIFNMSQTSRIASNALTIEVKPHPENINGLWRPAKKLTLQDAWKPDPPTFKVGEPTSRVIAINGQAVLPEQLPDFSNITADGIKIYQDKADNDTTTDGKDVVSLKQQTLVYIPERAGTATIPEISVTWWDTVNNKPHTEKLPAITINIQPSQETNNQTTANDYKTEPTVKQETSVDNPKEYTNPKVNNDLKNPQNIFKSSPYFIGLYIILGIAFGFVLAWLVIRPKKGIDKSSAKENINNGEKQALSNFAKACDKNDLKLARDFMLEWGKIKWHDSPPHYIKDLAKRLNDEALEAQILNLDRVLYMGGNFNPESLKEAFLKAVKKYQKQKKASENSKVIPDLYP